MRGCVVKEGRDALRRSGPFRGRIRRNEGEHSKGYIPLHFGISAKPPREPHPLGELSATTAASEKRCRHRFGAPGFLGRATACRWASSLAVASHAGREVLRSGRGCWRGDFVSGGAEAQLRAPTFSLVKGKGLGGRRLNSLGSAERIGRAPSRVPPWLRFRGPYWRAPARRVLHSRPDDRTRPRIPIDRHPPDD